MAKEFHSELSSLQIHQSGNQVTTFSDTVALRNFFCCQYPEWKEGGRVTSIPAGRVPRLFLTGDQTTTHYTQRMSSLQKGESGEIDVYRLLMNTKALSDGVLVLPNVDGNFFKSKVAKVELDIVVIHPKKGAFIFNVKNAKTVRGKELCEDMVKHSRFIRLVQTFKSSSDNISKTLPVHGIICSLKKTLDVSTLESGGCFGEESGDEKRFVIQPNEMKNFSQTWKSILSQVPDLLEDQLDLVDDFAATLGSLNSLEGSIAMIHKQLVTNDIQKLKRKVEDGEKILADSIGESICSGSLPDESEDLDLLRKELIALHTTSKSSDEKISFILWTKEQQRIISHIYFSLFKRSTKPSRILVCGPKGSGKTMLLVFIAHLANKIFKSEGEENCVAISDGRGVSQLLFEKLKREFKGTTITVDSGIWIADKGARDPLCDKKLVLYDECTVDSFNKLTFTVQDKHRVILFTSLKPEVLIQQSQNIKSSFTIFELKNSLRSTCEIVDFVESFRALNQDTYECEMVASHNLRGAGPNIQSISIDSQSDPLHTTYIDKVISVIKETLHKAQGLEHVLVTPFLHQITLQRILSEVQKNEWCYEYRNPADHAAKSTMLLGSGTKKKAEDTVTNKTGLPFITFCTGNHIDGAEYGAVIILLERSLPKFWEVNMHASLFIAITRATTMLSIVVNNTMNVPLIQKRTETINADAVPKIWNDLLTPADFDIPAYSFIECKYNDVFHSLERIITNSTWSRGPVLILGEHDCLSKFDEIDQPKDVWVNGSFTDEIKWYKYGTKIIVCARKYESSCRMFDRRMYMNMTFEGFSALIFLISSTPAYEEMLCSSRKHALMYYMFEEMLGACPIYILTSCSLNPRCRDISRINFHSSYKDWSCFVPLNDIGLICDFFTSFNRRYEEKNSDQPQKEAFSHQEKQPLGGTTTMTMRSWNELKELGNSFFKDRNYEAALSMYIDSIKMLRAEFYNSLENQEIDFLIQLQDERSKLCTNVSKTQFELATHGVSGLDVLKMELSLRYAEKSVELNPFWFNPIYYGGGAIWPTAR